MSGSWYRDKVVLVTGASAGIGRALVREASAAGAKVVALARSDAALQITIQGMERAIAIATDVRKPDQVQRAVEQVTSTFGHIDVAISNAGIEYLGPTAELSAEEIQAMFDTNFFGFFHLVKAVLPILHQQEGEIKGTFVYVSSPMSRFTFDWSGGYAASKAAAEAYARGLRRELKSEGIRIVTVYPGATETQVGKGLSADRLPPWHDNGPKMEPGECARRLLKAVANGQTEAVLATPIQVLMTSQRLSPTLTEQIIKRVGSASR